MKQPRASFSASIGLGAVSIPVRGYTVWHDSAPRLLTTSLASGRRASQTWTDSGETIDHSDLGRGYQATKDSPVIDVTAIVARAASGRSKTLTICRVAKLAKIPRYAFAEAKVWHLIPDGSDAAYILLRDALRAKEEIALTMGTFAPGRRRLLGIGVSGAHLVLSQLRWAEELRTDLPTLVEPEQTPYTNKEYRLVRGILGSMRTKYTSIQDTYSAELRAEIGTLAIAHARSNDGLRQALETTKGGAK